MGMVFATTWMIVLGTTTIAAFVTVMVLLMEIVTVMETFWTALVNVAALLLKIYVMSVVVLLPYTSVAVRVFLRAPATAMAMCWIRVAYVAELGPYTNVAVMIYLPMRVIVMATLLMNVVCVAVMGHPVQRLLLMRCSRPADQKETVVEVPPLRLLPVRGRCWWVVEPVITFTLQRKP